MTEPVQLSRGHYDELCHQIVHTITFGKSVIYKMDHFKKDLSDRLSNLENTLKKVRHDSNTRID